MSPDFSLNPCESIIFSICKLYDRYGYRRYKMNKFEEYDLYAHNKDFLISDGVITFTDTNGKLMALKPDVTLSIVKNTKDVPESVQKLYYNESVYRVSKGSRTFKEITQVGLECLGAVDDYSIFEVLSLAVDSLLAISDQSIIDISDLGLLSDAIDVAGVPTEEKDVILRLIGEKNLHELSQACRALDIPEDKIDILRRLAALRGTPDEIMPKLKELLGGTADAEKLSRFDNIISSLNNKKSKEHICIDFSVVDDLHYYNGIVFKGFVKGIPSSVLSGGQYDTLMRRMKKSSGAVGFAVYPDTLEQFARATEEYDVDAVLLYGDSASVSEIAKTVAELTEDGASISVQRDISDAIKYKKLFKLENGEVKTIENNA